LVAVKAVFHGVRFWEASMWYTLYRSPKVSRDFYAAATELLQSTFRHLVFIAGGA